MYEITEISDSDDSSDLDCQTEIMPKTEVLGYELPCENIYSRHLGDNVASSSGTNLRSHFIEMGFSPILVDKAIQENGEDDVDFILQTLCTFSDTGSCPNFSEDIQPKEEPHLLIEDDDDKKAPLLMMNFSLDEVDLAIAKLGGDAPINELVDFIFAARIAKNFENDGDDSNHGDERREDGNTEPLFNTMDKTLRLLEMGFTEREVSAAIDKYGSEIPLQELASSIVAAQNASNHIKLEEGSDFCGVDYSNTGYPCRSSGRGMEDYPYHQSFDSATVKTEEYSPDTVAQSRDIHLKEKHEGKRPKEEINDELGGSKRLKEEYEVLPYGAYSRPTWLESRRGDSRSSTSRIRKEQPKTGRTGGFGIPNMSKPNSCRSLDKMVAKPPYFFYANLQNLSHDTWLKISQFLYAIEPEFVHTHLFSALNRKEGYLHNLPTENRFHVVPKSPMTIMEAIPLTKKWWPSWDTRKQLSCINAETKGISQLCDRLGETLMDCKGILSLEQERDLLHQCQTLNLIWVGKFILAPMEAENLEQILGYPTYHTRISSITLSERLQSLKNCFQTDALGFHISVLKSLFPGGLTVLSIYSGIGGAEVSLHRLGIRLKGVVSVEPSVIKRRILKQWWSNSGQSGELVQFEDIQRLTTSRLDSLIKKFGGFDFITCQNPDTPNMAADTDSFAGLDFSMFYEFVRVLQRVRSTVERNR